MDVKSTERGVSVTNVLSTRGRIPTPHKGSETPGPLSWVLLLVFPPPRPRLAPEETLSKLRGQIQSQRALLNRRKQTLVACFAAALR